jgi:large repetitive protein
MRLFWKCLLAALGLFFILPGISLAISVTATQSPGNAMTANVTVNYSGECLNMTVSFGDGIQAFPATCGIPGPCTLTLSHTYAAAGSYTLTALGACIFVNPPNPGAASFTASSTMMVTSPSTLPAGTLAGPYNYQLQTSGGQLPYRYSIISGNLPAGLSLGTSGLISGTPTALGAFSFTVQVNDAATPPKQAPPKSFNLTVNPPNILGPSSMRTTVPKGWPAPEPFHTSSAPRRLSICLSCPRSAHLVPGGRSWRPIISP